MRIHSVEMAGFGPFLSAQRVDFDAFADDGIFLIQGRTGAGKSSILDAVVYALFNNAPRYRSAAPLQLRSHHCSTEHPTWVELEFSSDGRRYRVRRSPEYERPKSRGEGLTTERPTAHLWRLDGSGWTALESSVRTVAQALDEILPLSCQQFLQVVLLAQGEFARFLVADSAERKSLLGALFDTSRFESLDRLLQARVASRRGEIERAASATDVVVEQLVLHLATERPEEPDEEWLALLHGTTAQSVAEAEEARAAARSLLDERRREWEDARALLDLQQRRDSLLATLSQLEEARGQVEEARRVVARAEASEAVRPARETCLRLDLRLRQERDALVKAEATYEEVHGIPVPSVLADERDDLVEQVAAARQALELESRLATVRAQQDHVARRIEELGRQLEQVEDRLAEHRQVLDREVTTSVEKANSVVLELIDEQARSRRHAAAVAERARAEQELLVAGERRTRTSAALDAVRRRSLDQYAGRLAQGLVEGEACPVCGGVEHPAPAEVTGVPVREEDVEAAERDFSAAQAACTAAEALVAAARARESAHAGARSPELLAELVHEAGLVVRDAERQATERAEAATAHLELDQRRQRMSEEVAGLVVRAEALEERADELLRRVEAASGTSESVADRLDGLQAQLAALDGVLSCRRSEEKVQAEHATARAHLVEMLERHGFDDEAACVAAQRPAGEVEQLRREVQRHDELLTVTTSGLADPALHELPEDPCDPAPLERLVHEAATAHDLAAEAAGVATQRHGTTSDLVRRLRAAWARDADVRREFEVLRRLAATVHGEPPNTRRLRLESYVLSVELDQIVQAANRRLHVMSAGRYALLLDDRVATRGNNAGLEVRVHDRHTQETRAPESLSGGEKFLASLSLALGLSEVVSNRAGGVSLDTLFVDEGFGSLDAETLDLAMHTLDSLREHGRTVGVISHVEAMKERIPAQLLVEHAPGGWSTIRTLV